MPRSSLHSAARVRRVASAAGRHDGSGDDLAQITRSQGNEIDPAVSPDGKAIAYAVAAAAGRTIARRGRVARRTPKQVSYTSNEVLGRDPTWMPDSSGIVFVSRLTPNAPEKLVQTFGRTSMRPVFLADVGNPNFVAVRPAVSQSGKRSPCRSRAWAFAIQGGPPRRCSTTASASPTSAATAWTSSARGPIRAWSPDGKMIAFAQQSGGHEHLFVANADGSNRRQVTDGTADDEEPSWSPDGKRIVFCSAHGTDEWTQANLFVVRPDGSGLVQLTEGDLSHATRRGHATATSTSTRT